MSALEPHQQQRLRDMLEAKHAMDEAERAAEKARHEYRRTQTAFTGMFPRACPPGPFICGTTFIEAIPNYGGRDSDRQFNYTEAERCPTSE